MRDALIHRGPDDADNYIDELVSLGHRRLSILDLDRGRQPMWNEDHSAAVIFNGEIYNYSTLRRELEQRGHRFRTNADTESLIHAYDEWGVECLSRLDGMFAFVVYDVRKRVLFGARDRLGKKPFYYTVRPTGLAFHTVRFAFASEVKALRQHPEVRRDLGLSIEGLVSYLSHDYLVSGQSIYEGVARLEPGCAFTYGLPGVANEGLRVWRYWDIRFDQHGAKEPSEREAAAHVIDLLGAAVERRLVADVPLGAFLSGGIDSSTVVALMTRFRPARDIKTFSIAFDDPTFDESPFAADAARELGTNHYERRFTARELLDRLPRLVDMLDEPFADPSVLPASMLCEHARDQVTVALGGDGGDELFAGYDPLRAVGPAEWYRRFVPGWLHRRVAVPAANALPVTLGNMPLAIRARRFLRGAIGDPACRAAAWMGPFSIQQLRSLLPDHRQRLCPEQVYATEQRAFRRLTEQGVDPWTCTLDYFQRFYLPDDILVKIDRAGMMYSLEVRAPFLDTSLTEYVNGLPVHLKLRRGQSKYLLKRAVTGQLGGEALIPKRIAYRSKKGFGIPIARWIKGELREQFRETLLGDWPAALAAVDRREIERLFVRHIAGIENHYKEIWALFMLAHWAHRHL